MSKKGSLVIISGFSGAGKGTVVKELMKNYECYALSISATTRNPRPGEENGREYFFKTKEEFEELIRQDALYEYAQYVDNYYGTPKAYVEEQGYEVFPMSAPINQGVQEVLAAAANKLQQVLAEPQEEDDYELFDFEKDENDPDYRTVTVSYDGKSFVLHGKQLLKIFNSTNFTDFGSLRYLYKYIEKSGAIDQMKEMGIEDGDIIKIEDFEFEYYDEDYFED